MRHRTRGVTFLSTRWAAPKRGRLTRVSEAAPAVDPLVAAACSKSSLLWVGLPGGRPLPLWHVWHDDAVLVVVGGQEQPDPAPADATEVEVTVRSKDTWGRLVTFRARVEHIQPDDERWETLTFRLKASRLNAVDTDTLVDRWAAGSRVLRLVPHGPLLEQPEQYDDGSGAAPPPDTAATTTTWQPFHLGGRRRKRQPPR